MTASPQTYKPARHPSSEERSSRTRELVSLAHACPSEQERRELLNTVVEMHLDYAYAQAARYRSRGIPLDDLRQVAAMALTRAAQGYDVTTGHDFMSYAAPTIRGELRKHFRDHGWMIRPTRRIQELQARINAAQAEHSHQHGRSRRPAEIARHLQVPTEDVIEALASDGYFTLTSLDQTVSREGITTTLGDMQPSDAAEPDATEARLMLNPALRTLDERDRMILDLRFHGGLTQREIGDRLGITQMQISRILTGILGQLRHTIGEVHPDGFEDAREMRTSA